MEDLRWLIWDQVQTYQNISNILLTFFIIISILFVSFIIYWKVLKIIVIAEDNYAYFLFFQTFSVLCMSICIYTHVFL